MGKKKERRRRVPPHRACAGRYFPGVWSNRPISPKSQTHPPTHPNRGRRRYCRSRLRRLPIIQRGGGGGDSLDRLYLSVPPVHSISSDTNQNLGPDACAAMLKRRDSGAGAGSGLHQRRSVSFVDRSERRQTSTAVGRLPP